MGDGTRLVDWRQCKAVAVFCATYFFFNALMLIDYGASMRIAAANGTSAHAETLLLAALPPRIVYHAGVVLQFACFFLLFAVGVSELLPRRDQPCPCPDPSGHDRDERQ